MTLANASAPQTVPLGGEACEGRSAFRFKLDFSIALSFQIDLTQFIQQATIKSVQSLYVDNSAGTNPVTFQFGGTTQSITIPAGMQAYMPVLEANPPQFTVTTTGAQITNLQVLNFFVPPYMWGASGVAVSVDVPALDAIIVGGRMNVRSDPDGIAMVDKSGTITAGGTPQTAIAANANRKRFTIANPSTATEILQFRYGTGGYIDLLAGMIWDESGSTVSTDAIQVLGATTGHAFSAYEG